MRIARKVPDDPCDLINIFINIGKIFTNGVLFSKMPDGKIFGDHHGIWTV